MEAQQVEAYLSVETTDKLNRVVEQLQHESGDILALQWSWREVEHNCVLVECVVESLGVLVSTRLAENFVALYERPDMVRLLQYEFANKLGRLIIFSDQD